MHTHCAGGIDGTEVLSMNFTILSFLFALLIWAQPCDKKGVALNKEFDVKVGQEVTVEGENLKISFGSVGEDSRCPEGVNCIWAGNAKIAVRLQKGKSTASLELNTGVDPKRSSYLGYEVGLVALRPYPKMNTTIDNKGYVATLIVSKQ